VKLGTLENSASNCN